MNLFVGLDVSQKKTAVCVVDATGTKICQASIDTSPMAIYDYLLERGLEHSRIGMETGPLAVWLYHGLRAFGLKIDCIHARHVHAALTMQLNKTDQNDTLGIARLVQSSWYRPTHVKSLDCHQLRLLLTAREKLVQIRVTLINQIRGLLKTFGVVLPAGKNGVFERSVLESSPSIAEVKPTVLMLMQALKDMNTQIRA